MKWISPALAVCLTTLGCGKDPEPVKPSGSSSEAGAQGGGHQGHVHTAPNGGSLVILGDTFAHVELLLDPEAGLLTAWVLGPHASEYFQITDPELVIVWTQEGGSEGSEPEVVPLRLQAVANVLSGETVGNTSQFHLLDPRLKGQTQLSGTLVQIEVKGKRFEGVPVVATR